jgi:biotin operon repressor
MTDRSLAVRRMQVFHLLKIDCSREEICRTLRISRANLRVLLHRIAKESTSHPRIYTAKVYGESFLKRLVPESAKLHKLLPSGFCKKKRHNKISPFNLDLDLIREVQRLTDLPSSLMVVVTLLERDLSRREVAQVLGISMHSLRQRIYQIKKWAKK